MQKDGQEETYITKVNDGDFYIIHLLRIARINTNLTNRMQMTNGTQIRQRADT